MSNTTAASCGTPPSINGGSVITSDPYVDGSSAVYRCSSGYLMSGDSYITCANGTWNSTEPTCTVQDTNTVDVDITNNYDSQDIPTWLIYLIGSVVVLLALLLLTCILVWCCQLCGCFSAGGMFGEHQPMGSILCWRRKRRKSYDTQQRTCKTFPRRYEYDEDGRRFHTDDLGRRCYYNHKNKAMNGKVVSSTISENSSEATTPRTTFVQAVNEVMVEKRQLPAKEIQVWKPHANPVRSINTSTK